MRSIRHLVVWATVGLSGLLGATAWAQRGELRVLDPDRPAFRLARGVGQLLVTDGTGAPHPLPVVRYHAHLVLHPPVALVQIDQSFYNPLPAQAEGTFVFNLPRGASVSRFAMFVTPDSLMEGELVERRRASQVYEAIVHRRWDPAILEQIGTNLFKMRVFPIPSADTKRVLLDYTLPLESDDGQYRFVLPLPSEGDPIWDFRVTGVLRGPTRPGSVVCQTHPELQIQGGEKGVIRFGWKQANYRPSADLVLCFSEPLGPEPRLWAYTAAALRTPKVRAPFAPEEPAGQAATYFHLSIPPQAGAEPSPADVVVVAETSALVPDRRGVRQAVAKVLEGLRAQDRFRLVCVDVVQRWLTAEWAPATAAQRQAALRRLDETVFLGALDLNQALRASAKAFASTPAGRRRIVVYVGSAVCAEERQWFSRPLREKTLLALEPEILELSRAGCSFLAVIPVRKSPGEDRLVHVARKVGGLVFNTEFQRGQEELQAWLAAGLPTPDPILELTIEGARDEDVFAPAGWVPGRALTVLGRCQPTANLQVKLVVVHQGKPVVRQWTLAVDSKPDDVFVGRLWAQRKIEQLLRIEEGGVSWMEDAPRQKIVGLSQEWSLLTPYTAFLVLEREEDYALWGVARQLRRRYWSAPEALEPFSFAGVGPFGRGVKPPAVPPPSQRAEQAAVAKAITDARQALAAGEPRLAQLHLERVAHLPAAKRSAEYLGMVREVAGVAWRQGVLEALGPHRAFFEPGTSDLVPFVPDVWPLVRPLAPAEFLRTHPHAFRLVRQIEVAPRRVSVQVLANLLAEYTGANVVVDFKSLKEIGLAADREFEVRAWGRMTVRQYVRRALGQQSLVFVEEPHRLWITTLEEARFSNMVLGVYPVGDLVHLGRTADVAELAAPYLDAELAAQKRLREKLRRPVTFDYREAPLASVLADVARTVGDSVFVDLKAMDDAGFSHEQRVTAQWRDVPLGEALKWLFKPLGLDAVIHGESLVISMPEVTVGALTTRIHSCRGVVYALKPEVAAQLGARDWPWGWGWGSGGGSRLLGLGGFGGFETDTPMRGMRDGWSGMGGVAPPSGGFFGAAGAAFDRPAQGGGARMARGAGGLAPPEALSSGGEAVELPTAVARAGAAPSETPAPVPQEKPGEKPAPETSPTPPPTQVAGLPAQPAQSATGFGAWPAGLIGRAFGPKTLIDPDTLIETILSTVSFSSWDEVGGSASLRFFYPTLDIVVRATDDIHAQIEDLLERLRRLRPSAATLADYLPAEKITDIPQPAMPPDLEALSDLIKSQVAPHEWDEVGGPGSIREDVAREALVISASPQVHDEVRHLLTLLRRSRYEALRGSRPWETGESHTPWVRPRQGPALSAQVGLARLPEPEPGELQLLSVRRPPASVRTQCRRIDAQGKAHRLAWQQDGRRLQIELPGWTIRTEDEQAAIAYPTLQLVELGLWGESARRVLDAWLPWLPHRTNGELARLFQVSSAPAQPEDAAKGIVRLRFTLPSYADPTRAWIEAAFSKHTGQIVAWESRFDGRLAQRLHFAFDPQGPAPRLREVRLEDAAGKTLARWEFPDGGSPAAPIPPLDEGWHGYLRLDHRTETPRVDVDFIRGVQCLRNTDWENAARHLRTALQARPNHPLILLLAAYAVQQGKLPIPHQQVLGWLAQVVEGPAAELTRFIAQGEFPGLTASQTYELLARQPVAQRTAGDWERLAQAALQAERYELALSHAESASAAYRPAPHPWSLEKTRLLARLALGQKDQAAALVAAWTDKWPATPIDRVEIADRLAAHGLKAEAAQVYDQALATPGLALGVRVDLLRRRADVQTGLARWRSLLEAASLILDDEKEESHQQAATSPSCPLPPAPFQVLLAELNHPRDAAAADALAAEARHPVLRTYLLVLRAQLTPDPEASAAALDQAAKLGPLPGEFMSWACTRWNATGRHVQTIRQLEGWLRAGQTLWETHLALLEEAYRATGREQDALRAASSRSLGYLPLQ